MVLGRDRARRPTTRSAWAYCSADFRHHATTILMAQLLELHDHERFEWFAFDFGQEKQDAMRERVRKTFDHFIDVRGRSDQEVARLSASWASTSPSTSRASPGTTVSAFLPAAASGAGELAGLPRHHGGGLHGVLHLWPSLTIVQQALTVLIDELGIHPVGKLSHIAWRRRIGLGADHVIAQIMRHAAGADNQKAFCCQRC